MNFSLLIISNSFLGTPKFESTEKNLPENITGPAEVSNESPTEIQTKPTPFSEKSDENKKTHDYTTLILYAIIVIIFLALALIGAYNEGKLKLPSVFTSEPYDELPMAMNDINFERERGG